MSYLCILGMIQGEHSRSIAFNLPGRIADPKHIGDN